MSKYFLDTEFLEESQKTWFGKTKPTIDLISIGLVADNDREYYAISKDFNLKEAWDRFQLEEDNTVGARIGCLSSQKKVYWIRDNVLKPIFKELNNKRFYDDFPCSYYMEFTYKHFRYLIGRYGKSNKQIAEEVVKYIDGSLVSKGLDTYTTKAITTPPKFYGYYADYDWVVFCWLFGRMVDLPSGFPMYCNDLKQELERLNDTLGYTCDEKGKSYRIQDHPGYPQQENEHNALADARWNKELYNFLHQL